MTGKENEIYIHVGLHKTATTFLQDEVFPKLKGIKYYNLLKAKNRYELLYIAQSDTEGKVLMSDEDLSGSPLLLKSSVYTRFDIAWSLHELFPNAKIIIGIRDKNNWFDSVAKHILRTFPYLNRQEVINNFDMRYLDFEEYISILEQLWGAGNVYVYHYEHLKETPHEFVKGICDFIGVETPQFENRKINRALGKLNMKFILLLGRIYRIYIKKMTGVK